MLRDVFGGMFAPAFIRATIERAIKTIAQAVLATVTIDQAGVGHLNVNGKATLAIAAAAGGLSILTSLASLPWGPGRSPSLVADPSCQAGGAQPVSPQVRP